MDGQVVGRVVASLWQTRPSTPTHLQQRQRQRMWRSLVIDNIIISTVPWPADDDDGGGDDQLLRGHRVVLIESITSYYFKWNSKLCYCCTSLLIRGETYLSVSSGEGWSGPLKSLFSNWNGHPYSSHFFCEMLSPMNKMKWADELSMADDYFITMGVTMCFLLHPILSSPSEDVKRYVGTLHFDSASSVLLSTWSSAEEQAVVFYRKYAGPW